jgi:hypothetical protein
MLGKLQVRNQFTVRVMIGEYALYADGKANQDPGR